MGELIIFMNCEYYSLSQTFFLFFKKEIILDVKKNQIKINSSGLFKKNESTFNLEDIDLNPHNVSQKSLSWLIVTIVFFIGLLGFFISGYFQTALVKHYWMIGLIFFLGFCVSSNQFFQRTINRLLYHAGSKKSAFWLRVNNPNQSAYEEFVNRLSESIMLAHKKKEFRLIIQAIPKEFLEQEFSLFYVQLLLAKEVDVCEFLSLLKKSFLSVYIPENLVGNRLN